MPMSSPRERLSEFVRRFAEGDYEAALENVEAVIELYPNEGRLLWQRARALERLARYDEARAAVKRVLEVRQDFAPAWVMRAELGEEEGDYDPEPDLSRAIEIDPRHHEAFATRAGWKRIRAWTDQPRPDDHGPGVIRTPTGLRFKRVHLEAALADFDCAIAIEPVPNYRFARADLLHTLGRYAEAVEELDRLLAAIPEEHSLHGLAADARGTAAEMAASHPEEPVRKGSPEAAPRDDSPATGGSGRGTPASP